jgi:hypothetical protein
MKTKRFLSLLSMWFRDVAAVQSGNYDLIINTDKLERLRKFARNYRTENYGIVKLIEDAIQDVDRNIFPELLLTNLSIRINERIEKEMKEE